MTTQSSFGHPSAPSFSLSNCCNSPIVAPIFPRPVLSSAFFFLELSFFFGALHAFGMTQQQSFVSSCSLFFFYTGGRIPLTPSTTRGCYATHFVGSLHPSGGSTVALEEQAPLALLFFFNVELYTPWSVHTRSDLRSLLVCPLPLLAAATDDYVVCRPLPLRRRPFGLRLRTYAAGAAEGSSCCVLYPPSEGLCPSLTPR